MVLVFEPQLNINNAVRLKKGARELSSGVQLFVTDYHTCREELNAMKCRDNRVTSPTQSVWGVPLSVSLVILECKEFGASSIQDGECGLDADMIWNAFVVENVTIPCS